MSTALYYQHLMKNMGFFTLQLNIILVLFPTWGKNQTNQWSKTVDLPFSKFFKKCNHQINSLRNDKQNLAWLSKMKFYHNWKFKTTSTRQFPLKYCQVTEQIKMQWRSFTLISLSFSVFQWPSCKWSRRQSPFQQQHHRKDPLKPSNLLILVVNTLGL